MRTLLLLLTLPLVTHAQDTSLRDLKRGKFSNDSSYVYALPFAQGRSYFLIQGYNSKFSHRGEVALDFKMRKGSKVCAMREGVVQEIKENSNRGGLRKKYFADSNYILIQHSDESYAWYFHLAQDGVLVNVGDTVLKGQHIGFSGNTGYSAFPHLHVEVVIREGSRFKQIPMRFQLRDGIHYLKPANFYRNVTSKKKSPGDTGD
jgi:murein DD-endopeptidase MepM/ murein hydrolase activator NlpD